MGHCLISWRIPGAMGGIGGAALGVAGCHLVKIALISDCYLPRLGGIEVQVHDLARQLSAAGHEVEVFTATEGPAGERGGAIVLDDGVVVHRMALHLPGGIPINPLAPPHVRDRLRAGGFDVAHVHVGVVSPFSVSLVPVTLGLGLPTAVTWHSVIDRSAPWHRLLGRARRWAAEGVALSAVSTMAAARVAAVAGTPVAVLGNGIDTALWARPLGHGTVADGGPVRIVSALRLARRKRPGALLDALVKVRELTDPHIRLEATVFGDGPQRARLQRRIDAQGLGWVQLAGRVSRQELRTAYWRSHIYLSTTQLEAFGIAALEAKTAGLVVAARAGTGTEDFICDGVDGILAADDAALAARVAQLANHPGQLAGFAAAAAQQDHRRTWEQIVADTVAEYTRAARR